MDDAERGTATRSVGWVLSVAKTEDRDIGPRNAIPMSRRALLLGKYRRICPDSIQMRPLSLMAFRLVENVLTNLFGYVKLIACSGTCIAFRGSSLRSL